VVKNTSPNFFQNLETVKKDLKSGKKNLQVLCWTKVSSGEKGMEKQIAYQNQGGAGKTRADLKLAAEDSMLCPSP